MLLDSRPPQEGLSFKSPDDSDYSTANSSDSSIGADQDLTPSLTPTTTLVVTNLPLVLFSQAQDLRPLFFPFGRIQKLEILEKSAKGVLTVVVQYDTTSAAQEAKEGLQGQCYGELQIEAGFARQMSNSLAPCQGINKNCADDRPPLNPFATSFSFGSAQNSAFFGPTGSCYDARNTQPYNANNNNSNGNQRYGNAFQDLPYPRHPTYAYRSGNVSRSSSASSTWSTYSSNAFPDYARHAHNN